jgi:hypothetical protein
MATGKREMRSYLASGIRGVIFGTPVPALNVISPGQNPISPGIWPQISPAWRLGNNIGLISTIYYYTI